MKNSQNLGARTLFAPNQTLSAPVAPFLAPILCTVDGNVRGENGCEDTFIRTVHTLIHTKDTFSRTELSTQTLKLDHVCPQMPQERPVVFDHLEGNPALVPVRSILWIQSWIPGTVLFFMFLNTLRMSKLITTKLTGKLLSSMNIKVLFKLSLGGKKPFAVVATKFGHL